MAITKPGVPKHPAKSEPAPGQTPLREHRIDRFEEQNPMYECGYAKPVNARSRAFGMLGFPTDADAQIGGQVVHKQSEEERERGQF